MSRESVLELFGEMFETMLRRKCENVFSTKLKEKSGRCLWKCMDRCGDVWCGNVWIGVCGNVCCGNVWKWIDVCGNVWIGVATPPPPSVTPELWPRPEPAPDPFSAQNSNLVTEIRICSGSIL